MVVTDQSRVAVWLLFGLLLASWVGFARHPLDRARLWRYPPFVLAVIVWGVAGGALLALRMGW